MYSKQFGDIVISECVTPQSGALISAFNQKNGVRIFMDVNEDAIPDGVTAYLFGNKFIITVHWSGIEENDKKQLFESDLKLRFGLLKNGLFSFVKFGAYNWGDIILLPGLLSSMNDFGKTFDEVILVGVDSETSKIVGTRNFAIGGAVADFIAYGNKVSYNYFHQNGNANTRYSGIRELFDDWCELTSDFADMVRSLDLEMVASDKGIYGVDADANGKVEFFKF